MTQQRLVDRLEDTIERLTEERDTLRAALDAWVSDPVPQQLRDMNARLTEERDRLRAALREILNELGVPDRSYPAPVANAVGIAQTALQPPQEEPKDL